MLVEARVKGSVSGSSSGSFGGGGVARRTIIDRWGWESRSPGEWSSKNSSKARSPITSQQREDETKTSSPPTGRGVNGSLSDNH